MSSPASSCRSSGLMTQNNLGNALQDQGIRTERGGRRPACWLRPSQLTVSAMDVRTREQLPQHVGS